MPASNTVIGDIRAFMAAMKLRASIGRAWGISQPDPTSIVAASLQAEVERRQACSGITVLVIGICESAWANILSVVATSTRIFEIQPQLAATSHLDLPTKFALVEVISLARDSCFRDGEGSRTDGAHNVLVAGGHATTNFANTVEHA